MPDLPQISEAEFEVMKIVWNRLESENDPDTDQAACNKRSADL